MWVQEGTDCKNDVASNNSSLFSSIYSISRPKQSVTTIAIPMQSPKTPITQNKTTNNKNIEIDEKEKERTPISPFKVTPTPTPLSPAQFLQNMRKKEFSSNISDNIDDIPMFTTDDIEMEDFEGEYSNDLDADMDVDLTIIGKKLSYISISDEEKEEKEEKMKEIDHDLEIEFDKPANQEKENEEKQNEETEIEWDYYIPKRFDGLDIERTSEWQKCLDFAQNNNNLLIIELYSTVFGASDVMYPFIDEILHKKGNKKIKFIRLSISKMNEMKEIREIIVNNYFSTPIPIYIFVQNGIVIDELYGTKPKEFEQIIEKYLQNIKNNQSKPITPVKYTSILTQRPQSAYLSTTVNQNNSTQNVENIRNLIHDLDINQFQTTKLSAAESRSVGTTTQHVF